MKEIIEQLKALQENPDDLSNIPTIITKLEEANANYSNQEEAYQERIMRLQASNRSLLSQIPIPGNEPTQEPEDDKPSFEQAQEELIKAMQNVGGNV